MKSTPQTSNKNDTAPNSNPSPVDETVRNDDDDKTSNDGSVFIASTTPQSFSAVARDDIETSSNLVECADSQSPSVSARNTVKIPSSRAD